MIVCHHAKARTDANGIVDYYCEKLAWRMGLDGLEYCRQCPHYVEEKSYKQS